MFLAIGLESEKVYAEGERKADVLRELNEKYPYSYSRFFGTESKFMVDNQSVLPETILIKREVEL
mgnify:CR=1 FL=1